MIGRWTQSSTVSRTNVRFWTTCVFFVSKPKKVTTLWLYRSNRETKSHDPNIIKKNIFCLMLLLSYEKCVLLITYILWPFSCKLQQFFGCPHLNSAHSKMRLACTHQNTRNMNKYCIITLINKTLKRWQRWLLLFFWIEINH